jgi:hypothetical protein
MRGYLACFVTGAMTTQRDQPYLEKRAMRPVPAATRSNSAIPIARFAAFVTRT